MGGGWTCRHGRHVAVPPNLAVTYIRPGRHFTELADLAVIYSTYITWRPDRHQTWQSRCSTFIPSRSLKEPANLASFIARTLPGDLATILKTPAELALIVQYLQAFLHITCRPGCHCSCRPRHHFTELADLAVTLQYLRSGRHFTVPSDPATILQHLHT